LAEPEGYVRIFVDEGEAMRLLIADCRLQIEKQKGNQDHPLIGYTHKLLAAFSQPVGGPTLPTNRPKSAISNLKSAIVDPLSPRELEVLRWFKTELTGPEIAHELVISLSTVRTHTKRIYSKLNVNNRRGAVKRAAELDLI
jgi:LuxR family maltose regulon positive regulatory protein